MRNKLASEWRGACERARGERCEQRWARAGQGSLHVWHTQIVVGKTCTRLVSNGVPGAVESDPQRVYIYIYIYGLLGDPLGSS